MQKRKMPRDVNQRAKFIVDMLTGEAAPGADPLPAKDPARVERGKLGGSKGGTIRAKKLSPERRVEIARKAAEARWAK